jgi:hypothetical protein
MSEERASRRKPAWAIVSVVALAAVAAAYFIWPTPYVYVTQYPSVMRVNRFTGVEEWSSGSGWIGAAGYEPAINLTGEVAMAVSYIDDSVAKVRVRNDGESNYRGLHFRFTVLNSEGVVIGRTVAGASEMRTGETLEVECSIASSSTIPTGSVNLRLDEVLADARL